MRIGIQILKSYKLHIGAEFQIIFSFDICLLREELATLFVTSFRRMFYAYHQAMKHNHTNIILSSFSIPFVLKGAARILKIGLQIEI